MTATASLPHWINASDPPDAFPDVSAALPEPNGLLAMGGDLREERLLYAYRHGIFPWYSDGQPILWWSPDPRCVLRTDRLHLSRRARRALRSSGYTVEFNRRFADVVDACAAPRAGQHGTWITPAMRHAYLEMHKRGRAHSVEVMQGTRLVGGLYGLAIGRVFFGESMFSAADNGSRAALLALCQPPGERRFDVLDCQMPTAHLMSLGAETVVRDEFLESLDRLTGLPCSGRPWPAPFDVAALLSAGPGAA